MKKLEIRKEDLKFNLNKIREIAKQNRNEDSVPKLIVVVKGNGVGLDLIKYANFLLENNVETLAVSNYEEAIELRDNGIDSEILMLTPINDIEELNNLISEKITLTVGSIQDVKNIEEIVENNEDIEKVNVHLKIDTGLGRYGVLFSDTKQIKEIFEECKKVQIVGTYTHFSKPADSKWTRCQFDRFMSVISFIENEKYNPGIKHCCASTAFLKYPEMHLDAIRIGSTIQGRTLVRKNEFKKVDTFKTNITEIKELPKGSFVSYNASYKTKRDTRIAVIPVGYMDGFNKSKLRDDFSFKNNVISVGMEIKKIFKDNSLKVKINGNTYNIIGKLGMYHSIIDITDSKDVKIGDEVILDLPPIQTNEKIRREYI